MGKDEFDQESHWVQKYGREKLNFLTHEEYLAQSVQIEKGVLTMVSTQPENPERTLDPLKFYTGILVFGSWARGLVHQKTDLDIFPITRHNYFKIREIQSIQTQFAQMLEIAIKMPVNLHGSIFTEDFAVMKITSFTHRIVGKDYQIISPDLAIKRLFNKQ